MQRLEVSGAVRHIYGSLGVRRLIQFVMFQTLCLSSGRPFVHAVFFYGTFSCVFVSSLAGGRMFSILYQALSTWTLGIRWEDDNASPSSGIGWRALD